MRINNELLEFYGVLLGDGCISRYKNDGRIRYAIRIDGNSLTDEEYYIYLKTLIKNILGKEVSIRHRNDCNGLFIMFHDFKFAKFLHDKFCFPYGKKGFMTIPKEFLRKRVLVNSILRGFFDTDGCIYFTKNNSSERNYPIIELSTHNPKLLNQFKKILESKGFNVVFSHAKDSIKLHGKSNVMKWMSGIGSNNIDKYSKFLFWIMYGYCPKIEELPLKQRLRRIYGPERI